jgi:hypothetical protein
MKKENEPRIFHCELKGEFVKKCHLLAGMNPPKCEGCLHYKPIWRRSQFIYHPEGDPRLNIDTSEAALAEKKIYFSHGPLPKPKNSHSRLEKVFFVKDPVTGKQRRAYRADHELRSKFVSMMCFLCDETLKEVQREFCEGKGHINEVLNKLKYEERLNLILQGRQRFLKKSIDQIIKKPEMKSFRLLTSRTLAEWRRVHCSQLCIKENPNLKINVGRREKE